MDRFDAIVIGMGAMGASSTASLAQRGARVLGIDRFSFGHDHGSTHGENRLTRLAYFEHPDYVPLLKKSHELWRSLEGISGETIFKETGLLYFGKASSQVLAGVRKSAKLYSIPTENFSAIEIAKKYSAFSVTGDWEVIFEPSAGYLRIESALSGFASQAEKLGAKLARNEAVLDWAAREDGYEVRTDRRTYWGKHLVLALGPWNSTSLLKWSLPLQVRRQTQFWFAPKAYATVPDYPCFAFDLGNAFIYGFSPLQGKIKIADHTLGEVVRNPSVVDRMVRPHEAERVSATIAEFFPWLSPEPVKASVCLYTMTPDSNFVLDSHPDFKNVVVAAGFSGHGFKFAPVIGEVMADLALDGKTKYPVSFLNGRRFG